MLCTDSDTSAVDESDMDGSESDHMDDDDGDSDDDDEDLDDDDDDVDDDDDDDNVTCINTDKASGRLTFPIETLVNADSVGITEY